MELKESIKVIESLDFISKLSKQNIILLLIRAKPFTSIEIQANVILNQENPKLLDKILSFKDKKLSKKVYKVPKKYINKLKGILKEIGLKYKIKRIVQKETTFFKGKVKGVFKYEIILFNVGKGSFKWGHKRTGSKLGYPNCCAKTFKKLPNLIRKVTLIWGLLEKAGIKVPKSLYLINHVPCKFPYCDNTLKQANEFAELLKKYSKKTYDEKVKIIRDLIERELKSANFYFKGYINNSKEKFLEYKDYFREEVFDKLVEYLEEKGLIKV